MIYIHYRTKPQFFSTWPDWVSDFIGAVNIFPYQRAKTHARATRASCDQVGGAFTILVFEHAAAFTSQFTLLFISLLSSGSFTFSPSTKHRGDSVESHRTIGTNARGMGRWESWPRLTAWVILLSQCCTWHHAVSRVAHYDFITTFIHFQKLFEKFSESILLAKQNCCCGKSWVTHILLSGLSCRCIARENPNRLPGSPSFLMTWLVSRLKASTKPGSRMMSMLEKSAAKGSRGLGSSSISALSRCSHSSSENRGALWRSDHFSAQRRLEWQADCAAAFPNLAPQRHSGFTVNCTAY